jgi:Domain of unknown function (DUF3846)
MNATILKANGERIPTAPAGKFFSLGELQTIVGGYIEMVNTTDPNLLLVMDEEGKLKHKPLNRAATALYIHGQHDRVVGDVLVCPTSLIEPIEFCEGDESEGDDDASPSSVIW